jgi:CheY-like chemotaxis protein
MAHILVIDDDEALRGTFKQFLERFGHVVSSAANGCEGLRLLKREGADLVITDIFMPEADGLEVILEMKKTEPGRGVPVIAISGGSRTRNQQPLCFLKQAKAFGAAQIFYKPIDFGRLYSAVLQLLPAEA